MSKTTKHIAIVEDDKEISRLTCMLLESEGYTVTPIYNGNTAIEIIRSLDIDLIILDIMLPGIDGITLCAQLRDFYHGPILMLTGVDDEISEIASFKKGADDFVNKPFNSHTLIARIEALLRRCTAKSINNQHDQNDILTDNLLIKPSKREAYLSGELINLTSAELDLLLLLADHIGEPVNREACFNALRGLSYDGLDRSIDMKVSGLRKKLGQSDLIKTVRGKGYMLVKD